MQRWAQYRTERVWTQQKQKLLRRGGKRKYKFYLKEGKTARPFRYDLNQIPYDYTAEVTNSVKGFDLGHT